MFPAKADLILNLVSFSCQLQSGLLTEYMPDLILKADLLHFIKGKEL